MSQIADCIKDGFVDSVKLIPFLFITYMLIEWLEGRLGAHSKKQIQNAKGLGPVFGAALGVIPQCGFSTVAANFYAQKLITIGTLLAVFLSTSDEMLPIFLSRSVAPALIVKILALKCGIAMIAGVAVDVANRYRRRWLAQRANQLEKGAPIIAQANYTAQNKKSSVSDSKQMHIHKQMGDADACEHAHEQDVDVCGHSHSAHKVQNKWFRIAFVSLKHTAQIVFFLFLVSCVLNIVMAVGGQHYIERNIGQYPVLTCFLTALVGLIPNCAASVIVSQLYLEHVISVGALFSGLLVSAGVGVLVLVRENDNHRQTLKIIGALYIIGVVVGILLEPFHVFF